VLNFLRFWDLGAVTVKTTTFYDMAPSISQIFLEEYTAPTYKMEMKSQQINSVQQANIYAGVSSNVSINFVITHVWNVIIYRSVLEYPE
jgi:hypothetical protein